MSIVLELSVFNCISNFDREGNKGKQVQTTTNCYIPNQTLANKVANLQFLMKSVMKNRKHHKKYLLFEINMQNSQVHNVTPTL